MNNPSNLNASFSLYQLSGSQIWKQLNQFASQRKRENNHTSKTTPFSFSELEKGILLPNIDLPIYKKKIK